MAAQIERYFPDCMQGIAEFEQLAQTENLEFDHAWTALDRMLADCFVESADETGVRFWERLTRIPIAASDPISVRKFRILLKINNQLPYTMRWLENKLESVFGTGAFTLGRDLAEHTLYIETDMAYAETLASLYADLRRAVPANLILHTTVSFAQDFPQYTGFLVQIADEITI